MYRGAVIFGTELLGECKWWIVLMLIVLFRSVADPLKNFWVLLVAPFLQGWCGSRILTCMTWITFHSWVSLSHSCMALTQVPLWHSHIYGCNHCGLLSIGSVPPKPYHRCGSIQTNFLKRFTIGQMQKDPLLADSFPCPHCSIKFGHLGNVNNHICQKWCNKMKKWVVPYVGKSMIQSRCLGSSGAKLRWLCKNQRR